MPYNATPEVIRSIKREIENRKLSVAQVLAICEENHVEIAETTMRRFLKKDSEVLYTFRHETTVGPLWRLFVLPTISNGKDVEALIEMQNEAIRDLRRHIEDLKTEHKDRCTVCQQQHADWHHQIELKDQRIDHLHKHTEEQRAIMNKMQEQMDKILNALLDGGNAKNE